MVLPQALKTLTAAIVALPLLAFAPFVQAAATPAALTHYLVVDDFGNGYAINDPGIGNVAETTATTTSYTLDTAGQAKYNGHTTFKMRVNGGTDCLQPSSNGYVYDEGCNTNGTNQQFYHVDDYLYSVGRTIATGTPICIEGASIANGAKIVTSIPIGAGQSQWTLSAE